ncbi:DUF3747 domain-containing protein [Cyanobium sp. FGCU-52]|nr:DUF3747 domain-containing protein [Cyanobium sp. FGCU52]
MALAAGLVATIPAPPAPAQSLFGASEVDASRFVLVAAPIGNGERSQLNIYEQVRSTRPCFAVGTGKPAAVDPLLASFDFTGICSRYIDANGFSVRVAGSDLGTVYRLMVTREKGDMLLLAVPTRAGAGPEMVVARTGGQASGFLKLELEPGWRLMRRSFRGRALGHVYLYTDAFPGTAAAAPAAAPASTAPAPAAAPPAPPAP